MAVDGMKIHVVTDMNEGEVARPREKLHGEASLLRSSGARRSAITRGRSSNAGPASIARRNLPPTAIVIFILINGVGLHRRYGACFLLMGRACRSLLFSPVALYPTRLACNNINTATIRSPSRRPIDNSHPTDCQLHCPTRLQPPIIAAASISPFPTVFLPPTFLARGLYTLVAHEHATERVKSIKPSHNDPDIVNSLRTLALPLR